MAKRGGFPGGGMPGNMANLMKQAQKMQRQMEEQQKEMETKEFTATAGGGAVEITVSGTREVLKVKLAEEVVDPDDSDQKRQGAQESQDFSAHAEEFAQDGSGPKGFLLLLAQLFAELLIVGLSVFASLFLFSPAFGSCFFGRSLVCLLFRNIFRILLAHFFHFFFSSFPCGCIFQKINELYSSGLTKS